tara:strand:+ start:6959 stop:8848 length:1890 start_codon:yes stop_codon:yes gene_type:complete
MSLVVCSNEFNVSSNSGIFNPADFKNYLDNPLELPPKSQVAVQSVKLNKLGSIILNRFQRFGVYFGDTIDENTNGDIISSIPIDTFLKTTDNIQEEEVNYQELRKKIEEALNFGLVHPDISATVTLNYNASHSAVNNMTYKFTQKAAASSLNVRTNNWNKIDPIRGDITYNNSTTRITANSTSAYNTINNLDNPISLRHGILEFLVPTVGSNFNVGLRRADQPSATISEPTGSNQNILFQQNPLAADDGVEYDKDFRLSGTIQFYDYIVSVQSGTPDLPDKRLFIKQLGYDSTAGEYVYNNVIYWGNAKSISNASQKPIDWTNARKDGLPYDRIKFSMKNEYIEVEIGNASGNYDQLTFHPDDYGGSGYDPKNYNLMKPIDDTTRLLYPQVYIGAGASEITWNHYSGRTNSSQFDLNKRYIEQGLESRLSRMATNWHFLSVLDDTPVDRPINKLGTHSKLNGYDVSLLLGPDDDYNENNPIGQRDITDDYNANEILGFSDAFTIDPPYTDSTDNGSEVSFTYESESIPTGKSINSAFIRIKNLNLSTINAGLNRRSKIIYHIPRFDNSNNEVGEGLYFESPEKTYIDLNNSSPLTLSELNLDIVTQDETRVQDLTGRTIIVLHFREKPK